MMQNASFWLLGIGAVIVIAVIWAVMVYNSLVRLKNLIREAWSGISIQLKRRYDLIPNLVEVVKAYAAHEKETLTEIVRLRSSINQTVQSGSAAFETRLQAETDLSSALSRLMVVVENYPDLKANKNFASLHTSLQEVEEALQMSRRYYNGTVRNYLIVLQTFPSLIIGKLAGFKPEPFFALDSPAEAENKPIQL